jgi:hypothetical protein
MTAILNVVKEGLLSYCDKVYSRDNFLYLHNAASLSREATNTNDIDLGLTLPGLEPTIYRTRGEHVNHNATDAVLLINQNNVYEWSDISTRGLLFQ